MKVKVARFAKSVMIGAKEVNYFQDGSEIGRLYNAEFDRDLRLIHFFDLEDTYVTSVATENVGQLTLSNFKKTEASQKSSSVGSVSTKK